VVGQASELLHLANDSRIDSKQEFQFRINEGFRVPKTNCYWLAPFLIRGAFIHFAQVCEKFKFLRRIADNAPEV
jgi:hypothetical protein